MVPSYVLNVSQTHVFSAVLTLHRTRWLKSDHQLVILFLCCDIFLYIKAHDKQGGKRLCQQSLFETMCETLTRREFDLMPLNGLHLMWRDHEDVSYDHVLIVRSVCFCPPSYIFLLSKEIVLISCR